MASRKERSTAPASSTSARWPSRRWTSWCDVSQGKQVPAGDRYRHHVRDEGQPRRRPRGGRGVAVTQARADPDAAELELRGITKRFGHVTALSGVDLIRLPRKRARRGRRQRGRQVDADQDHQRRAPPRRGQDPHRGQPGRPPQRGGCSPGRRRDRLPGPGPGRGARRLHEHVPRPVPAPRLVRRSQGDGRRVAGVPGRD